MKICFLISNLCRGGAERVAITLSREWISLGEDVFFIFTSIKPELSFDEPCRHFYICKEKNISVPKKIIETKKIVALEKPDIIVSFLDVPNFIASCVASSLKIRNICCERNNPYIYPKNKLIRIMRRIAFNKSSHVVFQTKESSLYFSKKIREKSSIIVNPCDNSKIEIRTASQECKHFVALGRLFEQKNYEMMLEAFSIVVKKYSDEILDIYGEGPMLDDLKAISKKLCVDKNVNFMGDGNSYHVLSSAKCFLLSSDYEGMPNALIEALVSGVPSISTDCPSGGPRELKGNNNSLLLSNVKDSKEFAALIEKVILNYNFFYEESIKNSFIYKLDLNEKTISKKWLKLFYAIVNN